MSKTVAVITDSGYLANALGTAKESDSRYAKFAKRLIGPDGTTAVINYGWNGASNLTLSKNGSQGQLITLDAQTVVVSGSLKIGTQTLTEIINASTDLAIRGIQGTTSETTVTIIENTVAGQPRLSCVIGLADEFINKIDALEDTVEAILRFDTVYTIGDGLEVVKESLVSDAKTLRVLLGAGLKFVETEDSSSSVSESSGSLEDSSNSEEITYKTAITLDTEDTPRAGSLKPVTSDGIYQAIKSARGQGYYIGIDPTTNNMMLYYGGTGESSDSSSGETSGEEESSSDDSSALSDSGISSESSDDGYISI